MTTCSTCWYASGGDDRHCGKCECCPESARIASRARRRTFRLLKVRDLTDEHRAAALAHIRAVLADARRRNGEAS